MSDVVLLRRRKDTEIRSQSFLRSSLASRADFALRLRVFQSGTKNKIKKTYQGTLKLSAYLLALLPSHLPSLHMG